MFSKTIRADLNRYSESSRMIDYWRAILFHSGARYMFVYRNCRKFNINRIPGVFFRIWLFFLCRKNAVEIPHTCPLGEGLYMGHFKAIIINQNARIGKNCNISQGVTIGRESRGKREGSPVIGDRVLIGPNSIIVGNITIGNDALIAPLTFVNFDVPPHSIVMGSPGKIISDKGSMGYIKKILGD